MQAHKYTAVAYAGHRRGICDVCGKPEGDPTHILILPGMESAVQNQTQAAATYSGEELTKRMLEARPSIDARAGSMENDSPLFYGKINPTLF